MKLFTSAVNVLLSFMTRWQKLDTILEKQERYEPFQDDRELLWVDLPERGLTRGRVARRERVDLREG